ncbi:MAG: GGDEF domain-containing protein [Aquabacterium sp.]|nr:GGDEF domain-containing protein [Aquabacterium sp.]
MKPWARCIRSLLSLPRWAAVGVIVGASVAGSVLITLLSLAVSDVPGSMYAVAVLIAVLVPTLVAGPVAMVLLKLLEELNHARALAQTLANTDALTGALNRRCFMERGHQAVGRAGQNASPTSVLLMDIDDFKQINDRYGHSTGDAVLQMFARQCLASLRPQDMLARWGGEEFVALLPATAPADALQLSDRLCKAIAAARVDGAGGEPRGVTVSIGVASSVGGALALDALLSRADAAMYDAKRSGKNRAKLAA